MVSLTALKQGMQRLLHFEKAPEMGEVLLSQRRVYTVPSKAGVLFMVLLLVLFLTATNYSLNLIFALGYLLLALMLVNVLYTFRNLAYLKLSASDGTPVFAGETAHFPIHFHNQSRLDRYAIELSYTLHQESTQIIDISAQNRCTFQLALASQKRGYLALPRIRLQTYFPLGLLRAWSYWYPANRTLVFPAPESPVAPLPITPDQQGNSVHPNKHEDYAGVRSYQIGDPLKHLSWKHIARIDTEAGGTLISKQFAGTGSQTLLFRFEDLPEHLNLELRLSRLCSWILAAEQSGLRYSLHIANFKTERDRGELHQNRCLSALALYPDLPRR